MGKEANYFLLDYSTLKLYQFHFKANYMSYWKMKDDLLENKNLLPYLDHRKLAPSCPDSGMPLPSGSGHETETSSPF